MPRTAGIQPCLPVCGLSQRVAKISVRAANSAPKNATFAVSGDQLCTIPGGASKNAACPGAAGAACSGVIFSRLRSRMFSARNRVSSASTTGGQRSASSIVASTGSLTGRLR